MPDIDAANLRCRIGVPIVLNDGIVLRADLWWTAAGSEPSPPLPAVITFTPYGRDRCADNGRFFAAEGFLFVAVDCRGRGESEGVFAVYGDAQDFAQAVRWLAVQPECDGRVLTQGGSYAGINQWQVAALQPAGLVAAAPMVAPMPGWDSDYWGGIGRNGALLDWATLVQGRSPKWGLLADRAFWRALNARVWREARPRAGLTTLLTAEPNTTLEPLLRPFRQADWDDAVPSEARLAALGLPMLSITGLYDDSQVGAILQYERHDRCAPPGAGMRHLVVGPCVHAGTRPLSARDDEQMQDEVLVSDVWQDKLCADFYRHALGQAPRPAVLQDRVNVFVTALERWVHAPSVDALARDRCTLFPGPGGLTDQPPADGQASFWSDPLDTRYADLEAAGTIGWTLGGLTCGQPLSTDHADERWFFGQGLCWDTQPLTQDMLICGRPALHITISTNLPDADLVACVLKLLPDGRKVMLSTSMLRLRHRDGLDAAPRLMPPGQPQSLEFPLWRLAATRIDAGSRLRLLLRVPASIDFERQMNAAKPVAEQTLADATAGALVLHLGPGTRLDLPLLDLGLPQSPP
jgi:putative CocE/NonD family hydrolase